MKRVQTGPKSAELWAHVVCVNWTPELWFKNDDKASLEGAFLKSRSDLKCGRCKLMEGSCIQCDYQTCNSSFHVRCAIRSGHIDEWSVMQEKIGNPDSDFAPVFCAQHERVGNFKFKIKGLEGILAPGSKKPTNGKVAARKKPQETTLISLQDTKTIKELTCAKS